MHLKPGWLSRCYFALLIALMVIPGLQGKYHFKSEKPLTGAFLAGNAPDLQLFTWKTWFDGSFQDQLNTSLEQHIGFRNSLVRLQNQLDFSLFRKANAEGVLAGPDNILFEEDYIHEYMGDYFVGDSVWIRKAQQLKAVNDTLAKLGKSLMVIIEPGKATFYNDRLPAKYQNTKPGVSNYQVLIGELQRKQVPLLDLNQWFRQLRDTSSYPLFPRCGTHWSYYGSVLAADTTLRHIEKLCGLKLARIKMVSNLAGDTIRHPDYDIGLAMNLMFPIPHASTTNPQLGFEMPEGVAKPSVLIAGDSFYFNWLNNLIPKNAFGDCDFWYYNKNITRSDGTPDGTASQKDFGQEVLRRDLIVIMITGRFMHAFAWGFDEQLYDLFYPGYRDPVLKFENDIRCYGDLFKRMYTESQLEGTTIAARIHREASFMLYQDAQSNPDKYVEKRDLVRIYEMGIRGTPDWMEKIRQKAHENKISVDEQVRRDAEYIYFDKFEKNNPQ